MAHVVLDEDVQKSLAQHLRNAGHIVERAVDVGLGGASDEAIFAYAQLREAVVVTKDVGFVDATALSPDRNGVILLRFANVIDSEVVNQEIMRFLSGDISLDDMRGRFVVLEPGGRARFRDPER